jgi:hypothetical protein
MILKGISPDLNISKNIALVGSSANLNNSSYGYEIDQFDEVIRFNRAPTVGFEYFVGNKTTIRVVNNNVFRGNSPDNRFKIKSQPPDFIKNEKNCKIVSVEYKKEYGDGKKYIHKTSEVFFMDDLKFLSAKYKLNKSPTAGFRMLYILIQNNYKPTLYGFGINEDDKPTHYWETLTHESTFHNLSKEREIIKSWAEENKIIIKL